MGRIPQVIASAATLFAADLTFALAPGYSMVLLTVALVVLGLGRNPPLITCAKTWGQATLSVARGLLALPLIALAVWRGSPQRRRPTGAS